MRPFNPSPRRAHHPPSRDPLSRQVQHHRRVTGRGWSSTARRSDGPLSSTRAAAALGLGPAAHGSGRRGGAPCVRAVASRDGALAFITRGGARLKDVRPETLESKLQPGLYLCGEVLDLDGPCGGFNLQWAFASGYLAGTGAELSGDRAGESSGDVPGPARAELGG